MPASGKEILTVAPAMGLPVSFFTVPLSVDVVTWALIVNEKQKNRRTKLSLASFGCVIVRCFSEEMVIYG
jgi:hypothetical protein